VVPLLQQAQADQQEVKDRANTAGSEVHRHAHTLTVFQTNIWSTAPVIFDGDD